VKNVNKYNLPLHQNSLPLRPLFCGQTASSLRPYGRSGQIICIGLVYFSLDKNLKPTLKKNQGGPPPLEQ